MCNNLTNADIGRILASYSSNWVVITCIRSPPHPILLLPHGLGICTNRSSHFPNSNQRPEKWNAKEELAFQTFQSQPQMLEAPSYSLKKKNIVGETTGRLTGFVVCPFQNLLISYSKDPRDHDFEFASASS